MNGVRLPVPLESAYIRSPRRHALPHTYHKEDFCKLMTAARGAPAVIPLKSMRAQYTPAMYNPKASGMTQFSASVRPPQSGCGMWRTFPPYPPYVPAAHWWLSGNVTLGLIWGSVVHCNVFVLVCCAFCMLGSVHLMFLEVSDTYLVKVQGGGGTFFGDGSVD